MIFSDEPQATESSESQVIHRRGVLGALGLAGLGMLASTTAASAFTSLKKDEASVPKVSVPTSAASAARQNGQIAALPDLPEEWSERYGASVPEYLRYLNTLKLQRVCPKQVIEAHAKSKGPIWNTLPPKSWWTRMGYTLRVVDRIALMMDVKEVEVVSAYRCPAYNARCPGAKAGSWHQANVAADVKFPMRASQVTAAARNFRDRGLFKGGIGGYWNFTHIDTRGENINW